MTDEELEKLLERREERLRRELEFERRERNLERMKKTNDWMMRGAYGVLGFLLLTVWTLNLVQCEVQKEVDRIKDAVKSK